MSNFSSIKKLGEKVLIPENCEEICVPKLNREIFFIGDSQPLVKRADNWIRDTQTGLITATVAFLKLSGQILHAKKENCAINTKEVLFAALDATMLLGNVNQLLNNLCKEELRPTLSRDLQRLCDSSNSVTSYLLGDDLPRRIKAAKEISRIPLFQKPQRSHNKCGCNK